MKGSVAPSSARRGTPKAMQTKLFLRFLSASLAAAGLACASAPPPVPAAAPPFRMSNLDGEATAFDPGALARPTLFAFWATWCAGCKEEMPALVSLYARERGRLDVIGVNVDRDVARARRFAVEAQLPYTSVADADLRLSDLFGVRRTPTFILVDRGGRIRFSGPALDGDLEAALEAVLQ